MRDGAALMTRNLQYHDTRHCTKSHSAPTAHGPCQSYENMVRNTSDAFQKAPVEGAWRWRNVR